MAGVLFGLFECCDDVAQRVLVLEQVTVLLETDADGADVLVGNLIYDWCIRASYRSGIKCCPASSGGIAIPCIGCAEMLMKKPCQFE